MKKQATHYLGLDVHQATTVATCRSESGTVVLKATVPTEAKAIVESEWADCKGEDEKAISKRENRP